MSIQIHPREFHKRIHSFMQKQSFKMPISYEEYVERRTKNITLNTYKEYKDFEKKMISTYNRFKYQKYNRFLARKIYLSNKLLARYDKHSTNYMYSIGREDVLDFINIFSKKRERVFSYTRLEVMFYNQVKTKEMIDFDFLRNFKMVDKEALIYYIENNDFSKEELLTHILKNDIYDIYKRDCYLSEINSLLDYIDLKKTTKELSKLINDIYKEVSLN